MIDITDIDLLYGPLGPTQRQQEFRDSPAKYKLYGGAMGGGKSWALSAEALRLALGFNGNKIFLCRHEATAFRLTTLQTLLKLIAQIEELMGKKILSSHKKTEKTLNFVNGSCIIYGALGEVSDFERIKSLEIGAFGIDEASETVEANYLMLKSRLRWRLPDGSCPPYRGLLVSNPEPGWVKDTFVTPQRMNCEMDEHKFIQALPTDNPYLPDGYIDDLRKTNPPAWVDKYVKGSWEAMEGQIWPMFDYNTHVITPFTIPSNWKRIRAIDHGQTHPTCCLWMAIDNDGNIFVYKEYYSPGVVSEHCKMIKRMSAGEEYSVSYLDPSCWGKTREKEGKLWSINDEYKEQGIRCRQANNEVDAGLNRVGEFMLTDENRIHPITGKKGSPALFIFNNCKNLLIEIPDYIWKPQKREEQSKEAPKKAKDHACDALRYGIMSRPRPAIQPDKLIPYNSFLGRMNEIKMRNNQPRRIGMHKYG